MKVIFLDHDGVICLSTEWGSRLKKQLKWGGRKMSMTLNEIPLEYRFDNFNKKAIKVLNEILEKTGAEIVVSSDWKHWASIQEMGDYYQAQGIIKKPIDFTGNEINGDKITWGREWNLEGTRSLEIKTWLEEHPEITNWVAIDDLNMGKNGESWKEWGLDSFILTPKSNEGIKQSGIKEKVLKFLGGI